MQAQTVEENENLKMDLRKEDRNELTLTKVLIE